MTNHYPNEQDSEAKAMFVAQVGGDHYQNEYQHWDWVTDIKMGYLPGNATKYVSRWRKKNGIADLMKAMTYIEKMQVIRKARPNYVFNFGATDYTTRVCTDRFVETNKIPDAERDFIEVLTGQCDSYMLSLAKARLRVIIANTNRALEASQKAALVVAPQSTGQGLGGANTGAAGPVAATMGQGQTTNASTEPHNKAVDGMEHPFGYDAYDNWSEGDIT